jgi:hypothetical protein
MFKPEYKYWAWWNRLTTEEQEEVIKKEYLRED